MYHVRSFDLYEDGWKTFYGIFTYTEVDGRWDYYMVDTIGEYFETTYYPVYFVDVDGYEKTTAVGKYLGHICHECESIIMAYIICKSYNNSIY